MIIPPPEKLIEVQALYQVLSDIKLELSQLQIQIEKIKTSVSFLHSRVENWKCKKTVSELRGY